MKNNSESDLGSLVRARSQAVVDKEKAKELERQARIDRRIQEADRVGAYYAERFYNVLKQSLEKAGEYELSKRKIEFWSNATSIREFEGDDAGRIEAEATKKHIEALLVKENLQGDVKVTRQNYQDADGRYVKASWHTFALEIIVRW